MNSNVSKVLPFLEGLDIFADFGADDLNELAAASKFKRAAPGEVIFLEDAKPIGGFFASRGKIVLKKTTHKKKSITTQLLGYGDPFGILTAVQGQAYPLTAESLSESVYLHIEQTALEETISKVPSFRDQLIKMCSERMRGSHNLIAKLADASSETRVAASILMFGSKFGVSKGDGLEIGVTRQELAALAGTTVETCIRVTRHLENDGVLKFPKLKTITVLDSNTLEMLCGRSN
ncbi:MAG: Crp/Fnr family transcriptional regulator [Bdellovibrionota bacterium]